MSEDKPHLVFGKDGVLRAAYDFYADDCWNQALLPMAAVEQMQERSLFLPAFSGKVEIEPETTLHAILKGLVPWAKGLSDWMNIDFPAYVAESNQPIAVEDRTAIERIEVSGYIDLEPIVRYGGQSITEMVHEAQTLRTFTPPAVEPLNRIALRIGWVANGFEKDEDVATALAELPINNYAHAPVIIDKILTLTDRTQMLPDHFASREPILNVLSPLVTAKRWGSADGRMVWVDAELSPTVSQFLHVLLSEICPFRSPARRSQFLEKRRQRIEINRQLDAQEGKENSFIARGAFDEAFDASVGWTANTMSLVERVEALGVKAVMRRMAPEDD